MYVHGFPHRSIFRLPHSGVADTLIKTVNLLLLVQLVDKFNLSAVAKWKLGKLKARPRNLTPSQLTALNLTN
jgi:hypothetical protein